MSELHKLLSRFKFFYLGTDPGLLIILISLMLIILGLLFKGFENLIFIGAIILLVYILGLIIWLKSS